MTRARLSNLVLCAAAATFVVGSASGITVQRKAGSLDPAERAHHRAGPRPAVSPGIVSAVLKVKLATPSGTKHGDCDECQEQREWDSQEDEEENSEEREDDNAMAGKEGEGKTSVKVVSGLDDSAEEDDYGKKKHKKNEQNEIPDVPVHRGSFVGVDQENYDDSIRQMEWNIRNSLIGDGHLFRTLPHHHRNRYFHSENPPAEIPVRENVHGSFFETSDGYKTHRPGSHEARTPRPYHNVMTKYQEYDDANQEEQYVARLLSALITQKHNREMIHVDDKIDFPKVKENVEDAALTLPDSEISIAGKMDVI
ncbi:uncharacterized protein LOC134539745 [Bacillus rossius redtenbacheri]|uniref:uncharacterized protein LOC134539745 n=1 Tax=Bacillus rossius redtenbacheri TaxID=93214 RepID=UPI002FDE95D1